MIFVYAASKFKFTSPIVVNDYGDESEEEMLMKYPVMMKMLMIIAAIEDKTVTPSFVVSCRL